MAHGDGSEKIRQAAWARVIEPQISSGQKRIHVPIKPLMKQLEAEGFLKNRPRQFCTALRKESFLAEKGLVLDGVDGPPSGTSTTVVLHFRLANDSEMQSSVSSKETPEEWARRVTQPILGLMKEEIAAHGGGDAYLRWVRGEDDGAA
jgi:hypothetical protein